MKRILVTGGAGYLGSTLSKKLLEKGYAVRCFDRLYFGREPIKAFMKNKKFELIKGNIVKLKEFPCLLDGVDSVIHLAGLANDPTAELDPKLTHIVNYEASLNLAKASKDKGIKQFIFASSCSVYGKALADVVNEDSPINPVSAYAESKAMAEKDIIAMADDSFHPVSFRQATLYGSSLRMRFDLAINLMALHASTKKKIFIWGGGSQWRPFLHVDDAAEAMMYCLSIPSEKTKGKIYNLGSTKDNFKIIDLAKIVKDFIHDTTLDVIPDNPDKRSYCVNCDKVEKELKWKPKKKIEDGIKELLQFLKISRIKGVENPLYYNLRTMQKFINNPAISGGDPVRLNFLPFSLPCIGQEEEREVIDTMRSGWLTTGPKTQKLEEMFRDYIGCRHAIALSSCTAALHLSLVTLGIGRGDEVITSPITWPSTANVIVHTGAKPIFADINPDTLNIDPLDIEKKITKKTKAIIPVHMAGQPCELDRIRRIAKKHKLFIIEDAAHAIGAEYKGKKIGDISEFTCFSFYPIKNMTTVEGGLVATDNTKWADKLRVYSLHGVSKDAWKRYSSESKGGHEVVFPGFKYNMTDIQASFGLHQLPKLDNFIAKRRDLVGQYNQAFRGIDEISLPAAIPKIKHAHHLYIIKLHIEKLKITRDEFMRAMLKENIGTGLHFKSLHLQKYYRETFRFSRKDMPNATYVSDRILSLPLYPKMSQHDIDTVIKAVNKLILYYKK